MLLIAGVGVGISRLATALDPDAHVLEPGVSEPGMRVYQGTDVKVEYPEDWTQMVGDFGSLERYGVMLVSPNGSRVFVNVNEGRVDVLKEASGDADDISRLLGDGVDFRKPPPINAQTPTTLPSGVDR